MHTFVYIVIMYVWSTIVYTLSQSSFSLLFPLFILISVVLVNAFLLIYFILENELIILFILGLPDYVVIGQFHPMSQKEA